MIIVLDPVLAFLNFTSKFCAMSVVMKLLLHDEINQIKVLFCFD